MKSSADAVYPQRKRNTGNEEWPAESIQAHSHKSSDGWGAGLPTAFSRIHSFNQQPTDLLQVWAEEHINCAYIKNRAEGD